MSKGGYRPNSGRKKGSIPWNKGIPISEEYRNKVILNRKGKGLGNQNAKGKNLGNQNGFKKGQIGIWRGKRFSLEYRKKLSIAKGSDSFDPTFGRRSRIIKNGGFHTNDEWMTLKAQYNWTCLHCSKVEPNIKLTKDHIIPVSRGGTDNIENIQPLCLPCNVKKSAH